MVLFSGLVLVFDLLRVGVLVVIFLDRLGIPFVIAGEPIFGFVMAGEPIFGFVMAGEPIFGFVVPPLYIDVSRGRENSVVGL